MLYFAYGSNMDEAQMKERMTSDNPKYRGLPCGKFTIVGSARSDKYSLVFNKLGLDGSGKGNLEVGDYVEGIIYEIDQNGIERLDIDEAVKSGHYYRTNDFDVLVNNNMQKCSVYLAQKTHENLKPTKDYLEHLLKGKSYLSADYFKKLSETETRDK